MPECQSVTAGERSGHGVWEHADSHPLIGDVPATGATIGEFEDRVVARFTDGYLRDPKVSVEVLNYRPCTSPTA